MFADHSLSNRNVGSTVGDAFRDGGVGGVIDSVVHYCVANMPGAVPRTSTYALNNVTLPYALALADCGPRKALLDNPNFREGLNVCRGMVTHQAVANDLGYKFVDPAKALAA